MSVYTSMHMAVQCLYTCHMSMHMPILMSMHMPMHMPMHVPVHACMLLPVHVCMHMAYIATAYMVVMIKCWQRNGRY